ncbi:hypothetical protein BDP81DRAFT_394602 [Colletotrichum phormii]|uniref:Uncharacterized protein n=1 Tax=Colletotrichum phormii TaxID=359342 RepID=A0AAI9ZSN7_9PEZI|nr:uncharacterized protein BDP81DRAFT_394602 [Colletotrichum phormii]KAK1635942.1 hypothetical protein BDP81DRAFT_394602 [Colletotrichum phormii]
MSLLRLAFIRQPPQTIRILPTLRQCALRPTLRKSLQNQQCSLRRPFASVPPPPPPPTTGPRATVNTPPNPTSAGAGGSAGQAGNPQLPERLLIYHAGTGRTAFLAFWKITTVFSCVFFCFVAAPSYVRAEDKTLTEAAGLAACGIIPFLFISYTSAPFVTFIYLRLPPYARQSRALLERYVRTLPPTAQLEIGTMGLVTRPRLTAVTAAELRPVAADSGPLATRLGIVTHTKDVSALMAKRRWYHYRPVGQFGINTGVEASGKKSGGSSGRGGKGASHGVKDGWVWNIVRESLGKRK